MNIILYLKIDLVFLFPEKVVNHRLRGVQRHVLSGEMAGCVEGGTASQAEKKHSKEVALPDKSLLQSLSAHSTAKGP